LAKVTGIPSSLTIDDASGSPQDISSDVTNFSITTPQNQQETTGLDKTSIERLGLLKDCTVQISFVADFASNMAHDVFKADPASAATRTVAVGMADGAATLTFEANRSTGPDYNRGADGSLVGTATLVQANGSDPVWS
jgi:hypothetical protein